MQGKIDCGIDPGLGMYGATGNLFGQGSTPIINLQVPEEEKMVESKTRSVKYVHLEIIEKSATRASEPEAGLFRGMKTRTETPEGAEKPEVSQFIMIGDKEKSNDLKTFNLDAYNIMTVQMKYGETKELIIFKASEEDQVKALEMVGGLLDELRKESRMVDNDPEIIDVTKYKEIPLDLEGKKGASKTFTPGRTNNFSGAGNCNWTNNSDWEKKAAERKKREEEEDKMRWTPTLINRKGDCPALKELNILKKKLAAIATREYESELPEIKGEEEEIGGAKATGAGKFIAG